jgi:hypothetical protein
MRIAAAEASQAVAMRASALAVLASVMMADCARGARGT